MNQSSSGIILLTRSPQKMEKFIFISLYFSFDFNLYIWVWSADVLDERLTSMLMALFIFSEELKRWRRILHTMSKMLSTNMAKTNSAWVHFKWKTVEDEPMFARHDRIANHPFINMEKKKAASTHILNVYSFTICFSNGIISFDRHLWQSNRYGTTWIVCIRYRSLERD